MGTLSLARKKKCQNVRLDQKDFSTFTWLGECGDGVFLCDMGCVRKVLLSGSRA